MRKWKILDYGDVDRDVSDVSEFACPKCWEESELPVNGKTIAQIGAGLVFDPGKRALPKLIKCPHCRNTFVLDVERPINEQSRRRTSR